MIPMFMIIAGFLTCSALIVVCGSQLSRYGDIIAELTGVGKAMFGLVVMAAVTSLPELFTGISSIFIVDAPNIAVGDIMGSCAFNLLILAVLDYFVPGKPLSSVVTKKHLLAGFSGIFLISLSILAMLFSEAFPMIGWFSSASVLLIVLYLVFTWLMYKSGHQQDVKIVTPPPSDNTGISLRKAVKMYVLLASLVITGAIALPFFADMLAERTGANKSFVGTLLVAATTSLPELVTSISAVRRGSIDMAVGNVLGSNIFNMFILGLDDLMYVKGPLLSLINPIHALSGLVTLLMTAIAGVGIIYSTPAKRFVLGIDAIILILLYSLLMTALYTMG
ncbi:sodium:calcium antiporter [Chitinophaga sp. XS-30]|uniref:sodium:calcium antiporter n=1 Tax=Chitinophaga sp. XS-30 TaxID=2604421 RepID=UPI0011DD26D0|nr:sodium:calcium antiporter [Chitinophaga sp. XS-30]QEH42682.1 sodium:calcium antiporter [Chitinophaga sp. XS-30]